MINLDDLVNIDLSQIPDEYKQELLELLELREVWLKYNKLSSFDPYKFQRDFYKASATFKRRFLCAANRKSYTEYVAV